MSFQIGQFPLLEPIFVSQLVRVSLIGISGEVNADGADDARQPVPWSIMRFRWIGKSNAECRVRDTPVTIFLYDPSQHPRKPQEAPRAKFIGNLTLDPHVNIA